MECNYLVKHAMGVPCLTRRDNTERPETVRVGTNALVGTNPHNVASAFARLLDGRRKRGRTPAKWDGQASERVVRILERLLVST